MDVKDQAKKAYVYARVKGSTTMTDVDGLFGKPAGNPRFCSQTKLEVFTVIQIARNRIAIPIVFFIFSESMIYGADFGQMITLGIFGPLCQFLAPI